MNEQQERIRAFFRQIREDQPRSRWGRELCYELLSDDDKAQFDSLAAWLEQYPELFSILAQHFYNWLEYGYA